MASRETNSWVFVFHPGTVQIKSNVSLIEHYCQTTTVR